MKIVITSNNSSKIDLHLLHSIFSSFYLSTWWIKYFSRYELDVEPLFRGISIEWALCMFIICLYKQNSSHLPRRNFPYDTLHSEKNSKTKMWMWVRLWGIVRPDIELVRLERWLLWWSLPAFNKIFFLNTPR